MPNTIVSRLLAVLGLTAIVATPLLGPSTALASTTSAGALFLNRNSSTDSPGIRIDSAGGMHVVGAGYWTGIWPGDDPSGAATYAYCAPNADCAKSTSWTQIKLGSSVNAAQIELTPAGKPRILLQTADQSATGSGYASYWYAQCDTTCTLRANWSLVDVADTNIIDTHIWDDTKHSFALDKQGRPRFVYGAGELVYAYCDAACTATRRDPSSGAIVPTNWHYAELFDGLYFNEPALAFTSTNQPRVAAYVYDPEAETFNTDYLECNVTCSNAANWSGLVLMPEGSAPLGLSLRLDGTNRAGVAISESGRLWYFQCAASCVGPANWLWTGWDSLGARDADLVYDTQNRPHLAFGTDGGPFGSGLAYASCVANCASTSPQWSGLQVEDSSRLGQDLPRPMPAQCSAAGWFGAFRPSVALDTAGNPRFASDNQFWASCPDRYGIITVFEAVRIVFTGRPAGTLAGTASVQAPTLRASNVGSKPAQPAGHAQHLARARAHASSGHVLHEGHAR